MTTTAKERLIVLRKRRTEEIDGMKQQRDADMHTVWFKWQGVIATKREEWKKVLSGD